MRLLVRWVLHSRTHYLLFLSNSQSLTTIISPMRNRPQSKYDIKPQKKHSSVGFAPSRREVETGRSAADSPSSRSEGVRSELLSCITTNPMTPTVANIPKNRRKVRLLKIMY
jgi:hypothetical protein